MASRKLGDRGQQICTCYYLKAVSLPYPNHHSPIPTTSFFFYEKTLKNRDQNIGNVFEDNCLTRTNVIVFHPDQASS